MLLNYGLLVIKMGNFTEKCSCLSEKQETSNVDVNYNTQKSQSRFAPRDFMSTLPKNTNKSKENQSSTNLNGLFKTLSDVRLAQIFQFLKRTQGLIRGYLFRVKFLSIKLQLKEHSNNLIKKYNSLTKTANLHKAEKSLKNPFSRSGWIKYYPKDSQPLQNKPGRVFDTDIVIYNETAFYTGQVNIRNQRSGFGILTDSDGVKYQGTWINNKLNGWCQHIDKDGNVLQGKDQVI